MAISTAREMGVGLIAFSEPNRKVVKKKSGWVYDEEYGTK